MMKKLLILFCCLLFSISLFAGNDEIKLISLYPVPLKEGILNVSINFGGSGVSTLEVRNLLGKKVQEKKVPQGVDKVFFDNLDNNPNGVYVVLAKNDNGKVLEIIKFTISK